MQKSSKINIMDPNSSNYSSEIDESILAMKWVTASVAPRALKAAIELDLLEHMKKAGRSVSAAELAAQIRAPNPEAHLMIDRLLCVLAANGIIECDRPRGGGERLYSLTPTSRMFTKNNDGVSLAPLLLLNQDKVFAEAFYHLKDAVFEGGIAFNRAHRISAFEYPAMDPRFNKVFNQAMYEQSTIFMNKILENYNGFEGVDCVVDVGGGIGASLKMILLKYPSIKAINFDLPHVTKHAPSLPGVEHISGDMFVSVPKADVIFMKWICHDWSDKHCLKLLKNCYEAIPEHGKVIIAERIVPEIPKADLSSSLDFATDLLMLTYYTGGKERTESEFHALAQATGFKKIRKACHASTTWIMELYK